MPLAFSFEASPNMGSDQAGQEIWAALDTTKSKTPRPRTQQERQAPNPSLGSKSLSHPNPEKISGSVQGRQSSHTLLGSGCRVLWAFPKLGVPWSGPRNKKYSIWGSLLASPDLEKLPYEVLLPGLVSNMPSRAMWSMDNILHDTSKTIVPHFRGIEYRSRGKRAGV